MRVVLREAWATVRAQRVTSVAMVLVVTGMVVALVLTSGRTIAAEQDVVRSIDSVGTRSIVIRAERDAGLTTAFLQRIGAVEGVAWVGAFSPIVDGRNPALPDAVNTPVRRLYTVDPQIVGVPKGSAPSTAYASPAGLEQLRMPFAVGTVRLATGEVVGIAPASVTAPFLSDLEPLVLIPSVATGEEPVGVVVVLADRPERVSPLAYAITSTLALDDPRKATVTTSREMAQLRGMVESQLSALSRALIVGLVGATAVIIAALQTALVILRRKDFGRRRALGATRSFIVALQLLQTTILTVGGLLLGMVVSHGVLLISAAPLPGTEFVAAITFVTMTLALLASLLPALIASRRDPVQELRVP